MNSAQGPRQVPFRISFQFERASIDSQASCDQSGDDAEFHVSARDRVSPYNHIEYDEEFVGSDIVGAHHVCKSFSSKVSGHVKFKTLNYINNVTIA